MPLPNLLHKTPCTIQRIDRATTVYDRNAREPIGTEARLASITIPGQPRWGQQALRVHPQGPTTSDSGYILFRYVDLDALSAEVVVGDRITIQGRIVREVYVTGIEPTAHYADQNGASCFRAWFTDRKPAKERRA